jgi:hypothetical protein
MSFSKKSILKSILILCSGFAISFLIFFLQIFFLQPQKNSVVAAEPAESPEAGPIESFFRFDTISPQAWINSIYRYGIVAIGLFAAAGIVYGGIRYITSMGNPEAITSGKNAIFSAIAGLVVLLLSHLILKTIDPRLVELKLELEPIELKESGCRNDNDCQTDRLCINGYCIAERHIPVTCTGHKGNCDTILNPWDVDNCCFALTCKGWFGGNPIDLCEPDETGEKYGSPGCRGTHHIAKGGKCGDIPGGDCCPGLKCKRSTGECVRRYRGEPEIVN